MRKSIVDKLKRDVPLLWRQPLALPAFLSRAIAFAWFYAWALARYLWFLTVDFAVCWLHSRPGLPLLAATPAILVAGSAITILTLARFNAVTQVPGEYAAAVAEETRRENWPAVDLYLERLAYLEPSNPKTQFGLALAAERMGDLTRTRKLMQNIAPADDRGEPRAHFWLARDLTSRDRNLNNAAQRLLEHHLLSAIDRMSDDSQAQLMLGQLYLQQAKLDAAAKYFLEAANEQPNIFLVLMQIYARTGRKVEAERSAHKAIEYFQNQVKAEPHTPSYRLSWAQAEMFLTNYEKATQILLEGWAKAKKEDVGGKTEVATLVRGDDGSTDVKGPSGIITEEKKMRDSRPLRAGDAGQSGGDVGVAGATEPVPPTLEGSAAGQLQQALATVYVSWFDYTRVRDAENLEFQLELLDNALRSASNHPAALNRLAAFATGVNEESSKALSTLKQILAQGGAPATVHFILGTGALLNEDSDGGLQHLELAFEQMPRLPAVANNLAWGLAHAEPPQLERAEKIVNAAVKLAPAHAEIRATRAVIYEKLGKHQQAIVDFEFSLKAFPKRASIHASLAALYDAIGDGELADAHRKLEKVLKAQGN